MVFLQCKQPCRQRFLTGWGFPSRGSGAGNGVLVGAVRPAPLGGRTKRGFQSGRRLPQGRSRVSPSCTSTAQMSASCPAGPLAAGPRSQPGGSLSRRGTGGHRPGSGLSSCFPIAQLRRCPLPCAPGAPHTERDPVPRPSGGGTRTHTEPRAEGPKSPRSLNGAGLLALHRGQEAQDQVSVGQTVDTLGWGVGAGPLLRPGPVTSELSQEGLRTAYQGLSPPPEAEAQ